MDRSPEPADTIRANRPLLVQSTIDTVDTARGNRGRVSRTRLDSEQNPLIGQYETRSASLLGKGTPSDVAIVVTAFSKENGKALPVNVVGGSIVVSVFGVRNHALNSSFCRERTD